jgi:xylulokinase
MWAYNTFVKNKSPEDTFESVMLQASNLSPGADGLCFIPYLAGERSPFWSDNIKAGFYGLQLSHSAYHIIRAVMEGIAFSLRHLLDIYHELEVPAQDLVLAGGGAKTPGLCQVIADVCQQDVSIYTEAETVTRVLYALCRSALSQADFNETLVNTFPRPEIIHCNPSYAAVYQSGYSAYRRFADFAWQESQRSAILAYPAARPGSRQSRRAGRQSRIPSRSLPDPVPGIRDGAGSGRDPGGRLQSSKERASS